MNFRGSGLRLRGLLLDPTGPFSMLAVLDGAIWFRRHQHGMNDPVALPESLLGWLSRDLHEYRFSRAIETSVEGNRPSRIISIGSHTNGLATHCI